MSRHKGGVESLAVSGTIWAGYMAIDVRSLFFSSLRSAKKSIQISAFALGNESDDLKEFFSILEEKLKSSREIVMILNDDEKRNPIPKYSKRKISYLEKNYPERFFLRKFKE